MNVRRSIGIFLIAAGSLFCCGLLAFQYLHCADVWNNTHKGKEYASALAYFFEVSKGAMAIAMLVGGALALPGILLCKKR